MPRHRLSSVRLAALRPALLPIVGASLLLAACAVPAPQVQPPAAPAQAPMVAQSSAQPATGRVVIIDATDYRFAAPETIECGLVTFRLKNLGHEAHHAQLLCLKDGVTLEQFMATLPQGEAAVGALITVEGGPSAVDHHGTSEVTLNLREGQYLLACFLPSPDGVPYLAKGMLKPLRVTDQATAAALRKVSSTITLHDFAIVMPASLPAGRSSHRVVKQGQQWHEVVVVPLAPGQTAADVTNFLRQLAGAPPFTFMGGMQGLEVGGTDIMTLDLQPGKYAALCLIPDAASGTPPSTSAWSAPSPSASRRPRPAPLGRGGATPPSLKEARCNWM